MSRKFAVFSVFLISTLLPFAVCFSQTAELDRQRRQRREQDAQRRTDALFNGKPPAGTATVFGRSMIYSVHNGFGNTIALLEAGKNGQIRGDLGLTEEQGQRLKAARDMIQIQVMTHAPKYVGRFKKMAETDQEAIQQDLVKDFQRITDHVDTLVTPEQKEKSRTFMFQALGGLDSPMANPDMVKVLKLSDEQKEKTDAVFKEMEQERIAQMEEGLKILEKAIEKGGANMSPEDRAAIEAEGKALEARIFSTGKKLGEKLRVHLTEDQKAMEKQLLASRPSHLPRLPGPLRGDFSTDYAPGLNSWSPGQGTPDNHSEEKKRRRPFPQKEGNAM